MRVFYLLLLLIFPFSAICAQNSGSIGGYVFDARTEEPLIGVTVLLEGTTVGAATDINGYFFIDDIPPKTYNIKASFVGFEDQTIFNYVIRSGGNPDVTFRLKESVTILGDVVVTPNPFAKTAESPLSYQSLSKTEIESYPGGNNDIAKVVQSLPGVAGSVAGFRNDVIIRGGGPSENVYYLDGVEIPNINHFATQGSSGGPVGLLNVTFFEGVKVNTSAFSAQYDNVLSGVLQFDQRNANPRERKTDIRVSASEAAFTTEGPIRLNKEQNIADAGYIVSVRRSYLQFLFDAIGLPFLPDYWDYQYRVNINLNKKNELIVTGIGSIDDFRLNPPDEFDPEQEAILEQVPSIKQRTSSGGVIWKHKLDEGKGILEQTLSFSLLNNQLLRYRDNRNQTGLYFQNESNDNLYTYRSKATLFLGDWDLKFGANLQYLTYDTRTINQDVNLDFSTDIGFSRFGVFAEISRVFFKRLTASFGVRTDGNSFTDDGLNLLSTLSPRAALQYKLDSEGMWSLNAAAGRYFKLPPNTVLGFQNENGVFANRNVDYIRSDHLTLGLERIIGSSARISLEGFYKRYGDYPVSIRNGVSLANLGGDFDVFGNEDVVSSGEGRTYGIEFLYQQNLTKRTYAILAYTLFKSEFSGDSGVFEPSFWDNRHLITFTGGYKFRKNWEFGIRSRYANRSPFTPVDETATLNQYPTIVLDYSQIGTINLGSLFVTDIRIDKKWNFSNWTLNLFLDVQNVTNSTFPSPAQYGLARNEDGSLITPRQLSEITGVDNGSVLPSIGVVINF